MKHDRYDNNIIVAAIIREAERRQYTQEYSRTWEGHSSLAEKKIIGELGSPLRGKNGKKCLSFEKI